MKKKILMLLLLSSFVLPGKAQMSVTDPILAALQELNNLFVDYSSSLAAYESTVNKLQKATNTVKTVKTIEKLVQLMDEMSCATSTLQSNITVSGNLSCFNKVDFNVAVLELEYSSEILHKVLVATNLITMNESERFNSLDAVVKALEQSISKMKKINADLVASIVVESQKRSVKKQYHNGSNLVATKRY